MDLTAIQAVLPHRYPFLLVDRIVSLEPGRRIVGIKNVSANEPFFEGHFPGQPVMPGVLLVEAMAQAAAVLVRSMPGCAGKGVFLAGIDKARFRRPVVPGDQVRLELEALRRVGTLWKFKGLALADGEIAAEAELMGALAGGSHEQGESPAPPDAADRGEPG